jgi:hypothetical protein
MIEGTPPPQLIVFLEGEKLLATKREPIEPLHFNR